MRIAPAIFLIVSLIPLSQFSSAQIKVREVPDLVPVKESLLLSGNLDSAQYYYFLDGILKEQFDARRENLKKVLLSADELILHRERIKRAYLKLLGPFPEKTPLNPVVTGRITRDKYSIEKVAFESRPDHHVTALLYIPHGKGPFPSILHIPGHSFTAKGRDYYQAIGRGFALNGFVVLQVDPVCQGERCQICQDEPVQYFDKSGTPMIESTTGQHELYNEGLLLLGSGLVAWEAWDNIRSIDYLCTRKEVDTARIGVTGLSGGGTQTTYLIPLDKRIKAAAPSSYIATTEEKFRTIGSQDGCQQLYGEGKLGIEEQDFLFMAAPVPVMVLSTFGDFFSYKGSQVAFRELQQMYKTIGMEERVSHFSAAGEHGMPGISLEADIRWMSWWLIGDSDNVAVDTLKEGFLPLQETWVTGSGQVLTWFKDEKSILDYTLEMLEQSNKARKEFISECSKDELIKKVKELSGYEDVGRITGGSYAGSFKWDGLEIEKHLINRDRGLKLPALIISPEKQMKRNSPALIISGSFGKMNELANNRDLIQEKLDKGYIVMIVDVTNTGELRSNKKVSGSGISYEFAVAKMCIYGGKTLLGFRTEDLVIARNYLLSVKRTDKREIELLTSGQIGPCGIHALFFDSGFKKLYLKDSITSWEQIIKTHFKPDNTGIIVPDAMNYYDLQDLVEITGMNHIIVSGISTSSN